MTDPTLTLTDSRRLTGENLVMDGPGAVLEVDVDPPDAAVVARVADAWGRHLDALLAGIGWGGADRGVRRHASGCTLGFRAPIDALYTACEVNEAAFARTVAEFGGDVVTAFEPSGFRAPAELTGDDGTDDHGTDRAGDRLRQALADERRPELLVLQDAAARRGAPLLWDDDEISLGYGRWATSWRSDALPTLDVIRWSRRSRIPVVLVTGTNGKSTTVRMLSRVLAEHGWTTGTTSTDGITIGGELVDADDWSGPGGAREVLRDTRVEAAVLETARGGLLRRGLPVDRANAAIVTNIAADHLGEYGIHTLDDLAEAKLLVGAATRWHGTLVLNADDELLVRHAPGHQRIGWFSLDPDNGVVGDAVRAGGTAWVLAEDQVIEWSAEHRIPVLDVTTVPATMGGAARHNVANVLGVVGLARSLGVERATIAAALATFRSDAEDNPGRANLYTVGGATALVDFAHNPHGMTAILDTARRLDGERLIVHLSQAGDRSDEDIAALARTVWEAGPAVVVASDVGKYLRGREPGEVPGLIRDTLLDAGADEDAVVLAPSPPEGVKAALDRAGEGDVLCLLVLAEKDGVTAVLDEAGATPTEGG